ncbi:hypothetical protein [Pseudonocardia oroxyli]|uniref:META domain-containing protein n=1 Tax=Pseudonocardia oroxyli TaxID=366584 RepID=A0A1G8EFZ4_PSEOR|nr:hypothetical protein [Pseudonocardia oroxyli]SDH68825.1 hypothetical protein SAMN05216377_13518 [Pseudonocardia oroxyli]
MRETGKVVPRRRVAPPAQIWPLLLALVFAAACTSVPPRDVVVQPTQVDPRGLVGTWTIADSPRGEFVGAMASFDAEAFVIEDGCFRAGGQWRASWSGEFLARTVDAQTACDTRPQPHDAAIAWLESVTSVVIAADEVTFLDSRRSAVAQLLREKTEPTASSVLLTKVTAVAAGDLEAYAHPAPELPDRLDPAADIATGAWVPDVPTDPVARPSLDFQANGMWYAQYDCNGKSGPWTLTSGGTFLTLVSPDGVEGTICPTPNFLTALEPAIQAGVDRETGKLLFLDSDGQLLQSFRRPSSDDRKRPS